MKKRSFFCGVIIGGVLLAMITTVASGIIANLSSQKIYVNGEEVEMKAYNIEGNNYVRLRDVGKAVNFGVEYDDETDSVYIDNRLPCIEEKATEDPELPSQAEVYFRIFCDLYVQEEEIKYIALDLTEVQLKQKDMLIGKVEDFCNENGLTLLLSTFDELRENGYLEIKYGSEYFSTGILFSFHDEEVTDTLLVTRAVKKRGFLYAEGAKYTAEKKDGKWIIESSDKRMS